MKSFGLKFFIVSVALVFVADAIDSDILIAEGMNHFFHTQWNSISREVITGKGTTGVSSSTRSIASTINPAQDEDSPSVLDTAFPTPHLVLPIPDPPLAAISPVAVHHTYLSLCTLLL